jgi:hypothetical protein
MEDAQTADNNDQSQHGWLPQGLNYVFHSGV